MADVLNEVETATIPETEDDFKPQKVNARKGSTSGQIREVDLVKEWISSQRQSIGKQVTSDPLEEELTVGSLGYHEGIGRLPEETGSWSIQKASELGHST